MVYLSLGSNLGDRAANIQAALARLEAAVFAIRAKSSLYETAPRDIEDQPWFLNMCVGGETSLSPRELLSMIADVEKSLGRDRESAERWGPRLIDIDILLFDDLRIDTPELQVPHPRMWERRFVLEPLKEIAPEVVSEADLKRVTGQKIRRVL